MPFNYFLQEYIDKVFSTPSPPLGRFEHNMFRICGVLIALLLMTFGWFPNTFWQLAFVAGIIVALAAAVYHNTTYCKANRVNLASNFIATNVIPLKKLLEDNCFYNHESIQWLIRCCERHSIMKNGDGMSVREFISIVALPSIGFFSGALASQLKPFYLIMALLILVVLLPSIYIFCGVMVPEVSNWINKERRAAQALKRDLEYLDMKLKSNCAQYTLSPSHRCHPLPRLRPVNNPLKITIKYGPPARTTAFTPRDVDGCRWSH